MFQSINSLSDPTPFFAALLFNCQKSWKMPSVVVSSSSRWLLFTHADANTIHLSLIRLQMAKRGPDDIVFNHRMSRSTAAFLDSNNRIFFRLHIGSRLYITNYCRYISLQKWTESFTHMYLYIRKHMIIFCDLSVLKKSIPRWLSIVH